MKPYPTLRAAAALLAAIIPLAVSTLSAADTSVTSGPTTASRATLGAPIHSPDQLRAAIEQFRGTNEKLGKPRYLIAVTHEQMGGQTPTVADLNRKRDVERLVQQIFKDAGATVVDSNMGMPLLGSKPYQRLPAADKAKSKKEREALSQVVDVVVEVTILPRNVRVLSPSNESYFVVPVVATEAYRVTDSALLGAGSVEDVVKARKLPEDTVMTISMNARTETAIIALMEEMQRSLH